MPSHETRNAASSHPEVFCKKGILRNFAKFTEKCLCQSLNFNKVAGQITSFDMIIGSLLLTMSTFSSSISYLLIAFVYN